MLGEDSFRLVGVGSTSWQAITPNKRGDELCNSEVTDSDIVADEILLLMRELLL